MAPRASLVIDLDDVSLNLWRDASSVGIDGRETLLFAWLALQICVLVETCRSPFPPVPGLGGFAAVLVLCSSQFS